MSLSSIPRELSQLVFEHLDHGDKIRMSSTCKVYRTQLVPDIFRAISFSNDKEAAMSALAVVQAHGAHIKRIAFTGRSGPEKKSTATVLAPAAARILGGSLTPNLHTISIKFDFNFEEDCEWILDSNTPSSIYVFDDVETEELALRSEQAFIWRALMTETWLAVSTNKYARELIVELIPKWSSAFVTDEFGQFLSRIEFATFNIYSIDTDGCLNTTWGYIDFLGRLDETFFHHMQTLKSLHIKAADPLGLEGCHHIPLALKAGDLPALEHLKLEGCFISPELVLFVQGHAQCLKSLDIKECVSGGHGYGMATNAIYWAKFFDDIYSARPILTSLIVGGGLAPLTDEETWGSPATEPEPEEVTNIRQTINTDPHMKLFGYGRLDDKYGMFFLVHEDNVEQFRNGADQRAYDRLMGLVNANIARAE